MTQALYDRSDLNPTVETCGFVGTHRRDLREWTLARTPMSGTPLASTPIAFYKSQMMKNVKKAVDLFCGCGGISAGIEMAGYEVSVGVDVEEKYLCTFNHNFPSAISLNKSVTDIHPSDISRLSNIVPGQLDLLVGGPPCQGFSKNVPRRYRYLDDPKNLLVKSFLQYAEFLKPSIILMENVAEMKNGFQGQYTDEVISRLTEEGYTVTHGVLNAADYGVPQRRRRAFFMANRLGLQFTIPRSTHLPKPKTPLLITVPTHVSVWEAISDLPSIEHGMGELITAYATEAVSDYQHRVRNANGFVSNHVARSLKEIQYARLASLQPGQGHKDLPVELKVRSGYSGAYGRLTKDMIAPTITRWVFHPGSGRYGHPVDTRVISIREVARLQGFSDSFEFIGSYLQQAGQLGNAVPPLMVYNIISDLELQLTNYRSSSSSVSRTRETLSSAVGNVKVSA